MRKKIILTLVLIIFSFLYLLEGVRAIDISECSILNQAGETYYLTANIMNENVDCIQIRANNIVFDCQNFLIDGAIGTTKYGIQIEYSADYVTVKNCRLTEWGMAAILLDDNSDGNTITNVDIRLSVQRGIWMQYSDNNNLTNIYLYDNYKNDGLVMTNSHNNDFTNITSNKHGQSGHGINLYNSNSNNLTNVTSNSNEDSGISLDYSSTSNTIKDSTFQNNQDYGIHVGPYGTPASNNIYNNLFNNTNNFYFTGTISQNYFNTTRQTGNRIYSSGTEIGGNYWTNPTGTGYSETCTDADIDGFCANYYELDATGPNRDYLPLSDEFLHYSRWSNASTNLTLAGHPVEFRLKWTDNYGLSGYIFSIDNGTATFSNDTWKPFLNPFSYNYYTYRRRPNAYSDPGSRCTNPENAYDYDSSYASCLDGDEDGSIYWWNDTEKTSLGTIANATFGVYLNCTGTDGNDQWSVDYGFASTPGDCSSVGTWYNLASDGTDSCGFDFKWASAGNSTALNWTVVNNTCWRVFWNVAGPSDEMVLWIDAFHVDVNYFVPTGAWSNETYVVNETQLTTIKWKVYVNDTDNNWNVSDEFSFVTLPDYCDVFIESVPYTISQNNTYYCLTNNFYDVDPGSGDGAVELNTKIENSTLDCVGYNLDGTDANDRYGVHINANGGLTSNTINITIKNCNISDFYWGIYDENSLNTTIVDNTFISIEDRGIYLARSNYTNVINNTFEGAATNGGIRVWGSASYLGYHNIENNYIVDVNYGIYLDGLVQNSTIKNNTVIDVDMGGIYSEDDDVRFNLITNNTLDSILFYDARNNTIENNTVKSIELSYSVYNKTFGAAFNILRNNIVRDGDGIKITGSQYNILIDNTVFNTTYGIYLDIWSPPISENNNVTGGSVYNNTYDYYIVGGSTNYFRNTNFTSLRKIYIYDAESWFNYNNESTGELWLKNSVSAAVTLTRELINWSQSIVQWNDSSDSPVTATYNISGLLASTNYNVFRGSSLIYTIQTDSSGFLNFSIYLSNEHEIKVEVREFKPSGTLISTTISEPWYITQVIPTWNSNEPTDTSITIYVSANSGTDWEQVTNGTTYTFLNTGRNFKYKAVFQTSDVSKTPILYDINFFYSAISNETITIRTEVNKNVYVGFFDITLVGSETTYKDKFQKSHTLP